MDRATCIAALAVVAAIAVATWARWTGRRWHRAETAFRALRQEYEPDYGPCEYTSDGRCQSEYCKEFSFCSVNV